jgi:serine phosphatase RsbU (regulator of sigma subunit)
MVMPDRRELEWRKFYASLAAVTDGLTEVFDRQGQELGLDGFAEAFRSVARRPLMEAHAVLLDTVRRFGAQTDDQTLLLMRRR